jgi:hypothetical protein
MQKVNLNPGNKKKLELKKTAIANLQISEGQMKMIMGGNFKDEDTSRLNIGAQDCTHIPTHTAPDTV